MVDFITSLDSYGTAEGWPGLWGMEGPEYLAWIKEDEESEHIALMGATTYREMSGYAAEMPDDPGLAAMTETPKVVFSSTLEKPLSWANTELVDGDAVEGAVRTWRRDRPRPLAHGRQERIACARSLRGRSKRRCDGLRAGARVRGLPGRQPAPREGACWALRGIGALEAASIDGYPDIALDLVESSRMFDGRLQLLEYEFPPAAGPMRGRLASG